MYLCTPINNNIPTDESAIALKTDKKYVAKIYMCEEHAANKELQCIDSMSASAIAHSSYVTTVIEKCEILGKHAVLLPYYEYNLQQYLQKHPICDFKKRLLASYLLRCVNDAHQLGIYHNNLKLSNILIGDNGRVVITDWGLSRSHNYI